MAAWLLMLRLVSFGRCDASQLVYSRFYIELINGGDCLLQPIDAIYDEAIDMARVAVNAIDSYYTNQVARAHIQTYLGIDNDRIGALATARDNFEKVILDSTNVFDPDTLQPALFCDENWLVEETYERSPVEGVYYTGRTTSDAFGGMFGSLFWSNIHKSWAGRELGCDANTLAYYKGTLVRSITICPRTWTMTTRKDSLSDYRNGITPITDGQSLAYFTSTPATLLHEIFHMVSNNDIDDQLVTLNGATAGAYSPAQVAELASSDVELNLKNAESYTWFAVASYLQLQDWSRVIAGEYVATSNTRRSNETTFDSGHRRDADDEFKRLSPHQRRQQTTYSE